MNEVVLTLVGAIVTLVGTVVWAVKFSLNQLFGSNGSTGAWGKLIDRFDKLESSLHRNTETLRGVQGEQQNTNRLLTEIRKNGK